MAGPTRPDGPIGFVEYEGPDALITVAVKIVDLEKLREYANTRHRQCWGYPLPPDARPEKLVLEALVLSGEGPAPLDLGIEIQQYLAVALPVVPSPEPRDINEHRFVREYKPPQQREYELGDASGHPFIRCRICDMTSYNPGDILMHYCANCDMMHDTGRPRLPQDVLNYQRLTSEEWKEQWGRG